jgi:hypothetical protein
MRSTALSHQMLILGVVANSAVAFVHPSEKVDICGQGIDYAANQ